jgi:YggT family protein
MSGLFCTVILLYTIAVFARVILSWFPVSQDSALATVNRFLFTITEPVMAPLRRAIPPVRAGAVAIDISVLIVFIALIVLRQIFC